MARFGLTLSSEEHGPTKLVEIARAAEKAGFDFVSISDHFHPWISAQGHSPFVWSVLGALSEATDDIDVVVGVTCPTIRTHPAILAHAVATTSILFGGRFTWGVGSGENLNEHVLGDPWPPADIRLEMLEEAIEVIRKLWSGDSVNHRGDYYEVEDARIFDLPDEEPAIVVSAFGEHAARLAARVGDGLWTTGIPKEIIETFKDEGGRGPIFSQLSLAWADDRESAIQRVLDQWPNTGLPGQLAQDLRTVAHFEQAIQLVDANTIEESGMALGPKPGPILDSIEEAVEAGIDHVYLHQIGDPVDGFIEFWGSEIKPELKRYEE